METLARLTDLHAAVGFALGTLTTLASVWLWLRTVDEDNDLDSDEIEAILAAIKQRLGEIDDNEEAPR